MPLAVVAWPVVPWIARAAMRAFAVCLLVPVMWALCFAASAAVSLNAISFNASSVLNALLEPLVAIVLLWVMLRLPIHLAKVAMLGAAPLGGGFASRAVSYAAGSQLRDTARQHLPAWAGGQPTSSNEQTAQAESRTGTRLRQAATLAGASATGGATGAAAAAAGGGASAGNRRGRVGRVDRHRSRRGRERALVHAAADGAGQRRRTRRRGRAADSELSRAGLRQRDVRGQVPRAHEPRVRRAGHERRSRRCRRTRSAGSASWSQSTAPGRASISPTRRWANGHPRSAKRCARSPPPAPRSAPKRSATRPTTGDQQDGWTPVGVTNQDAARRAAAKLCAVWGHPAGVDAAAAGRRQPRASPEGSTSPTLPDRLLTTTRADRCVPRQLILSRSFGSGI